MRLVVIGNMKKLVQVSAIIISMHSAFSCKEDQEGSIVSVETFEATLLGATVATLGGEMTLDGNPMIMGKGICFGTKPAPTISDNKVESLASGNGVINVELTGLGENTLYYARAYALSHTDVVYGNEVAFNTGSAGVYVGGQNAGKAVFWKNGVLSELWGYASEASSMVVYGKDIYFAGKVYNGDKGTYSFVYWKNGTPVNVLDLNSSNIDSRIGGIAISGNDVHIVWTEKNTTTKIGTIKYWKNSKSIPITDGILNAEANAIVVSGNDVYIGGSESNGTYSVASYWKNRTVITLTVGKTNAAANSVYVYNNDIYVAGTEGTSGDLTQNINFARYWVNGAATRLTDGTKNASAQSVFADSNGIYVAGMEQNVTNKNVAKFWKNKISSSLTDGTIQSFSTQIVVSDNDVYVLGKEGDVGTIWKNGARLAPFDGSDPNILPLCLSVIK